LAHGLDTLELHALLYQAAFLENDTKGMEAQVAALSGKPGVPFAFALQSSTEAYFGRLGKSRELSRQTVEVARRENLNELAAQIQESKALREAEFGNFELAKQAVTTALTFSSGRATKPYAALALARVGDITRAEALANELNKGFASDTLL